MTSLVLHNFLSAKWLFQFDCCLFVIDVRQSFDCSTILSFLLMSILAELTHVRLFKNPISVPSYSHSSSEFFFSRTSNLFQNSNKVDVLVLSHSKCENLFLRTCLQLFKTCVLSCKFLKFNHLKCVVFILFDWLCCLHTWMIVIALNE